MKRRLADIGFCLMLAWVGVQIWIFARSEWRNARGGSSVVGPVPEWTQAVAGGHASGPASARATIVVFSDFQCPFCRKFAITLDSVRRAFPGVRVIERHYPLTAIHERAYEAALAAECASDKARYAQMRDALFGRADLLAEGNWAGLAALAGLKDTAALRDCVDRQTHADVVLADVRAGEAVGVQGTPSILVNDSLFVLPPTYLQLVSHLSVSDPRSPTKK